MASLGAPWRYLYRGYGYAPNDISETIEILMVMDKI